MSDNTILVTGGTGILGRQVTALLREAGHETRVLSRTREPYKGDLRTGEGLAKALDGVATVVHCATAPRGDDVGTRRLIEAAKGVGHLVYISIVGVDGHPFSYYRAKRACELLVERSGVPYTILRATQFHELVAMAAGVLARLPVVPVPTGTSVQPVDSALVARRMAELATGEPAGWVPDIGGPRVEPVEQLMRTYLRAKGKRRAVVRVRFPGRVFAAFRRGDHLAPGHADGTITFAEWLG